jgi:hypothetical protein
MGRKALKTKATVKLEAPSESNPAPGSQLPKVTKSYPRRTMLLVLFGGMILAGAAFAVIYVFTMNMALGFIGVPLLFAGGMGFYYYWNQSKEIQVRYVGEVPTHQVNSLVIYPGAIRFEDVANPTGYVWHSIDDGKPYYIYWDNPKTDRLEPFNLPDQQYYDPQVFAENVLSLPCHRKIFQRRQDLFHKLKPFIAAIIGLGLWILIITTTGGAAATGG